MIMKLQVVGAVIAEPTEPPQSPTGPIEYGRARSDLDRAAGDHGRAPPLAPQAEQARFVGQGTQHVGNWDVGGEIDDNRIHVASLRAA
jgi:hypothetical protein